MQFEDEQFNREITGNTIQRNFRSSAEEMENPDPVNILSTQQQESMATINTCRRTTRNLNNSAG